MTSHVAPKLSNHTANPRTAVLNQELKNWPKPCLAPSLRLLTLLTIMISLEVSGGCLILRQSPGSGVFSGRIYRGRVPPPAPCQEHVSTPHWQCPYVGCIPSLLIWSSDPGSPVTVLAGSDLPRGFLLPCAVHLHSCSMGRVRSQPGCTLPLLGL